MERAILMQGKIFAVERVAFSDAQGRRHSCEIVRHPGAVTVIPVHADGRLVLIRNWRASVERWLHEFCAGKLERGEEPTRAAARELEEETGFSAATIARVGEFLTSPGFTDERMHVFHAAGLQAVPRRLELGEQIEVVTHTVDEVRAMIANGAIEDGKTIAAFAQWELWRKEARP